MFCHQLFIPTLNPKCYFVYGYCTCIRFSSSQCHPVTFPAVHDVLEGCMGRRNICCRCSVGHHDRVNNFESADPGELLRI